MYRTNFVNVTALRIHLSESTHDAVKGFPEFVTKPRGNITVKVRNYYSTCYHLSHCYSMVQIIRSIPTICLSVFLSVLVLTIN